MKRKVFITVTLLVLMAAAMPLIAQEGTAGLAYTAIDNGNAYSVGRGTTTGYNIVIPATYNGKPVTAIADNAFMGNNATIQQITIPASITTIGSQAFYGCIRLTNITIPASVTRIGDQAFGSWAASQTITIQGKANQDAADAAWQRYWRRDCNAKIVYQGATTAADTGTPGLQFAMTGGGYQVTGCPVLSGAVVIPASYNGNPVIEIYNWVFRDQRGITSITIPSSVTDIGMDAFRGCTGITSITIPANVTYIGSGAFRDWTASQTITIRGKANQAAADREWGAALRSNCNARIVYQAN